MRYFKSIIRGYHVYKEIWKPVTEEILPTKREPDNKHDSDAIAIMKSEDVVGHVPKDISRICSTFIARGGSIECKVMGPPRQQEHTMTKNEERLEVPCIYKLSATDKQNLQDVKKQFKRIHHSIAKWVHVKQW